MVDWLKEKLGRTVIRPEELRMIHYVSDKDSDLIRFAVTGVDADLCINASRLSLEEFMALSRSGDAETEIHTEPVIDRNYVQQQNSAAA